MNRHAQVHLMETVAVLIIFFILIVFGLVFYFRYQQVALKEKSNELLAARAVDTTTRTMFLPELLCTKGAAEPEDNCVDVLKLHYANSTILKYSAEYYFDLFSYANVTVTQIYPEQWSVQLYYQPKPAWKNKEVTFFVVSLRDDTRVTQGTAYGLGYLTVEAYS